MSEEAAAEPDLSEPVVIQTAFVNGVRVTKTDGHLRLVGWEYLPEVKEHRIGMRSLLTETAARSLWVQLGEYLGKGGEH